MDNGGLGFSATSYVEVYDEPDHNVCLSNRFIYAYKVQIPPGKQTLWHRHSKDTVYLSLGAATAGEELVSGEQVITDIPCGAAVGREHFEEPLIHKVTNVGGDPFFLVGIEAHAPARRTDYNKSFSESCNLIFETERFKVSNVSVDGITEVAFPACALLVSKTEATVDLTDNDKTVSVKLQRGDVYWFEEETVVALREGHRSFVVVLL